MNCEDCDCNSKGNTSTMSTSYGYPHLEIDDSEINEIYGRDRVSAHLLMQANQEKSHYKRNKIFDSIVYLYSTADKILMNDVDHLFGRAYICLLENRTIKKANDELSSLIKECLNCIPNTLGRSPIEFQESKYKSELINDRITLRAKKKKMDEVRSNIAYSLMRLGKLEQARMQFELALKSNSMCVLALIGLAVIHLNNCESPFTLNLCYTFSKQYNIDTINVETLNKIAFGYFIEENYTKAEQYSNFVIRRSKNANRLTESYHLLGKIYEHKGNIQQTCDYFHKAIKCAPRDVVYPYYDLGQFYIFNFEDKKAEFCFEKCLLYNPECIRTKKILGSVYSRSKNENKKRAARAYLKEITDEFPDDLEAWVIYALLDFYTIRLLTPKYSKILDLMDSCIDTTYPPFEILNGIAILHCRYGKLDDARYLLEKCLELLKEKSKTSTSLHLKYLTSKTRFQLAKVDEQQEEIQKTRQMYKMNPINLDVHSWNNKYVEKTVLHELPSCSLVLSFQKTLTLENEEDGSVLNPFSLEDVSDLCMDSKPALLQHSNNYISTDINVLKLEIFSILINSKPHIIWCRKGLGHNLANNDDMISKIKYLPDSAEKLKKLHKSWFTFAGYCLRHKLSSTAIDIFETCLKLFFYHHNLKVCILLGIEYIIKENFRDAKKLFEKALRVAPQDSIIVNYLARTLQLGASKILMDDNRSVQDTNRALEDIKLAKKYYVFMLVRGCKIVSNSASAGLQNCQQLIISIRKNSSK